MPAALAPAVCLPAAVCLLDLASVVCFSAELVKQAVEEDNAGNYQRALELYKQGLDWFQTHLKFEKNPHSRKAIMEKASSLLSGCRRGASTAT